MTRPIRLASSGSMLGLALFALPTAVAVKKLAATPLLILTALVILRAEWTRLGALLRGLAPFWPLLPLLLWALATAPWSIAPALSAESALRWGLLALLGGAVASVASGLDGSARRRAAIGLAGGVGLGALFVLAEVASGMWIANALRGFPERPVNVHALKPATSVLSILVFPAVLAARRCAGPAAAVLVGVAGAASVVAVPGESARLALLAGATVGLSALLLPAAAERLAPVLAVVALLSGAPLLFLAALAGGRAGILPLSAVHRLAIWDFVLRSILSRLALGLPWALLGTGFETARVLPGGQQRIDAAVLDRLGVSGPGREAILAAPDHGAHLLPLHPHNGVLQVLLELGPVGLVALLPLAWAVGRGIASAGGRGVRAALSASATSGLVVVLLAYGAWQAWWAASLWLAVAACRLVSTEDEKGKPPPKS